MYMTRRVPFVATCLAVLMTLVPVASAQTAGGADLRLAVQGPASTPLVGDIFDVTFTVANAGPSAADQTFLSNYLPAELELRSAVPSDPASTCTKDAGYPEAQPAKGSTGSGSSPGYYGGGLNCDLGTLQPGAQSTVKLTLQRVGARETFVSASVSSAVEDPTYENNYKDLFLTADRSNPADVGVSIAGPKSPDVGATFEYTVTVTNHGPSRADNVQVTHSSGGTRLNSFASSDPTDTCSKTYDDPSGYFELRCELGSLGAGSSTKITLSAERASAWEIYNSAFVTTANLDENYENDYGQHVIAADPSVTSDLTIKATPLSRTPLVGETFKMMFTVSNRGPSQAGDVWVSDYLTDGLEFVSVAPADKCSFNSSERYPYADGPTAAPAGKSGDSYYPVSPDGLYCQLGALPSGASATIEMTVTRTKARELWNSAWVSSSNHDPMYENNYSELQLAPDKTNPADLAASVSAPANPPVGSSFDLTMSVTNEGPSDANGVELRTYLPYGLDFEAVTPEACAVSEDAGPQPLAREDSRPAYYGNREVTCDFGTVPVGETRTATVSVTRATEYEIWASAWTSGANYDENYDNDYASLRIDGEPYPGACPADGGGIEGTKGSDTIVIGDCAINTKAGNDSVEAAPSSEGGARTIRTGRGSDEISILLQTSSATRRRIVVEAGRGRDTIRLTAVPGAGNATVILKGNSGDDNVVLDLSPGATGLRIVVRGQDGSDTVTGGSKNDASGSMTGVKILGGGGTDILEGSDGDDLIFGGAAADRLFGGLGDDDLDGGMGRDICRGGPGLDSSHRC